MTLRDLTKRQMYNLRRKAEKQKKEYLTSYHPQTGERGFMIGFDKGVKAVLELFAKDPPK